MPGRTTSWETAVTPHRIFSTSFASIYPHYVLKAQRNNRSKEEVDHVISWLTGYDTAGLGTAIADEVDLETFFARAPRMNPHASLIKGVICGYRVEEIEDPLMQKIRYVTSWSTSWPGGRRWQRSCGVAAEPTPRPREPPTR
jgi:hypothetical protein